MRTRYRYAILIFILAAFVMSAMNSFGQKPNVGIYFTIKYHKKCPNQVIDLNEKKFCLADEPVLSLQDLSYISTIKLDLANRSYFSLVFTEEGAKKLKNLSVAFPNTEIVLVVDKLIVGFLTNLETLRSNSLKMSADQRSGQNVEFVHEKLKEALPVKN